MTHNIVIPHLRLKDGDLFHFEHQLSHFGFSWRKCQWIESNLCQYNPYLKADLLTKSQTPAFTMIHLLLLFPKAEHKEKFCLMKNSNQNVTVTGMKTQWITSTQTGKGFTKYSRFLIAGLSVLHWKRCQLVAFGHPYSKNSIENKWVNLILISNWKNKMGRGSF